MRRDLPVPGHVPVPAHVPVLGCVPVPRHVPFAASRPWPRLCAAPHRPLRPRLLRLPAPIARWPIALTRAYCARARGGGGGMAGRAAAGAAEPDGGDGAEAAVREGGGGAGRAARPRRHRRASAAAGLTPPPVRGAGLHWRRRPAGFRRRAACFDPTPWDVQHCRRQRRRRTRGMKFTGMKGGSVAAPGGRSKAERGRLRAGRRCVGCDTVVQELRGASAGGWLLPIAAFPARSGPGFGLGCLLSQAAV